MHATATVTGDAVPISKRTGRRYAAGSATKWGGWESRVCCYCGQKITLKGPAAMFAFGPPAKSWHMDCAK